MPTRTCRFLSSSWLGCPFVFSFFFFNDTATTEIYTLSLHDALPICLGFMGSTHLKALRNVAGATLAAVSLDRKSTRLNSSHGYISYAVFCLKKKKKRPLARLTCPRRSGRVSGARAPRQTTPEIRRGP